MTELPHPLLIGMIHLPALPGSPGFHSTLDAVIEHALTDAATLRNAGFASLMVENFGDAPFTAGRIEPVTVAAMAIVVREVIRETGLPVGVNCLRNDAASALGIAAATQAEFIRVNVHTGVMATDQGIITGQAYDTLRQRRLWCPAVRIFADVHVKHAVPLNQPDIALAAEEAAYRGQADAVIVSGLTTGRPVDLQVLRHVKSAVSDRLVLVGSGATAGTIRRILDTADGAIVGTSLKRSGDITRPIDSTLAREFIDAALA